MRGEGTKGNLCAADNYSFLFMIKRVTSSRSQCSVHEAEVDEFGRRWPAQPPSGSFIMGEKTALSALPSVCRERSASS